MTMDISNIVDSARQALAPVGATLSDTWSALIGDRVAAWRLKNAAALQRAVQSELSQLGLKVDRSKVPERYALTWFEEATKQDEPEIQELFARLLARAAAGDADALDRRHLEMLTSFTPMDAKTFQWFFNGIEAGQSQSMQEFDAWQNVKIELGEAAWMSMEHLLVLGAVERRFDVVQKEEGFRSEQSWSATAELVSTERGISLYRACRSGVAQD